MPINVHCISDLHGRYESLKLPACDLLLIAGDIFETQYGPNIRQEDAEAQFQECTERFFPWLHQQNFQHCVFIWGNHDFIGESHDFFDQPLPPRVHFLHDSLTTLKFADRSLKIFGTPWTPWFGEWAFNAPEPENHSDDEPFLSNIWDRCPVDTDILLCHGPPKGYGDLTRTGKSAGSAAFTRAIQRIKPKLAVFGHIHEAAGSYTLANTQLINASVVDFHCHIRNHGVPITL